MPLPSESLKLSKKNGASVWTRRNSMCCARKAPSGPARALNNEKRPGIFVCIGCTLPLFTSEMKYESGTGWPSFFTTIPGVFGTTTDYKLILPRTEYHCIRCGVPRPCL